MRLGHGPNHDSTASRDWLTGIGIGILGRLLYDRYEEMFRKSDEAKASEGGLDEVKLCEVKAE